MPKLACVSTSAAGRSGAPTGGTEAKPTICPGASTSRTDPVPPKNTPKPEPSKPIAAPP